MSMDRRESSERARVGLVATSAHDADDLTAALEGNGFAVAHFVPGELQAAGRQSAILVVDARHAAADLHGLVAQALRHAPAGPQSVLVALNEAQLDLAWDQIAQAGAHMLCNPTPLEWRHMLASAVTPAALHDSGSDTERDLLHALHAEMGELRTQMTRLLGEKAREPVLVADDPLSGAEIRKIIKARRLRERFIEGLLADPAWDILLDLTAADIEKKPVSVSSLCVAAAVPSTTALRWIKMLENAKLITRAPDPQDRRRSYMSLTELGRARMHAYFSAMHQMGIALD